MNTNTTLNYEHDQNNYRWIWEGLDVQDYAQMTDEEISEWVQELETLHIENALCEAIDAGLVDETDARADMEADRKYVVASIREWINREATTEAENDADWDEAFDEFNHISNHSDGRNSSTYKSSEGHEFICWFDDPDEAPEPESDMIEYHLTDDGEKGHRFTMTLPFNQ